MALVGPFYDPQFLEFANCHQCIDNATLEINYPLICCSNDLSTLMENVEQAEVNKLRFWPNI